MPVLLNQCKCHILSNFIVRSDGHPWVPEPGVLYWSEAFKFGIMDV